MELIDKNKLLSILEEKYNVYYGGRGHNYDIAYGIDIAIDTIENQKGMIIGIDYAACNNSRNIPLLISEKRLDADNNVVEFCPVCEDVVYENKTKCEQCGHKLTGDITICEIEYKE